MAIRVLQVAEIVEKDLIPSAKQRSRRSEIVALLSRMAPAEDANPASEWKFELEIGQGSGARIINYRLAPMLPRSYDGREPFFIVADPKAVPLVYFRDRLFLPERRPVNDAERTEIALRVKRAVYDEEAELFALREAVANMEAAIEFQRSGPKRDPIPEDVKLLVWARDGGACVRCGLRQDLHFDHIIPVVKGGGNSEANIQILCQQCNQKKSDKIGFV